MASIVVKVGVLALLICGSTIAAPLFQDSFESGDISATNSSGFEWYSTNRTGIVTSEAEVYNNGTVFNAAPPDSDWTAKEGDYSLRFNYPAGVPWSEQRFSLGGNYPDLWFSFWLRVPQNFYHPTSLPTNNKVFALWMDGYSYKGDGPTVFWNILSNGSGGSEIAYSHSEGSYQIAGPQSQEKQFIRVPDDRGRWMKLVIHVKASSRPDQSDGVIELWRRWENENEFQKYHEDTSAKLPIPSGGPDGWSLGYLMGWANAEYESNTDWLLDEFTVSETSLLTVQEYDKRPNPPVMTIQ